MTNTDNHGYHIPEKDTEVWDRPLNGNFELLDVDTELRGAAAARSNFQPKAVPKEPDGDFRPSKYLVLDTGEVFFGFASTWEPRFALPRISGTRLARNVIGGHQSNVASGNWAAIGGGIGNEASDDFETVPGGASNVASGTGSFAADRNAKARYWGAFVWAEDLADELESDGENRWSARATGGVRFVTWIDSDGGPLAGVWLDAGSGSWASLSASDAKVDVRPVDPREVLDAVESLPNSRWRYRSGAGADHLGPMAEDFHAAFGLGADDEHITGVDWDGVALAAIHGLADRVGGLRDTLTTVGEDIEARDRRIEELREEVTDLRGDLLERGMPTDLEPTPPGRHDCGPSHDRSGPTATTRRERQTERAKERPP